MSSNAVIETPKYTCVKRYRVITLETTTKGKEI
jgi:hypothetical protein